jgi:hypothetical protein
VDQVGFLRGLKEKATLSIADEVIQTGFAVCPVYSTTMPIPKRSRIFSEPHNIGSGDAQGDYGGRPMRSALRIWWYNQSLAVFQSLFTVAGEMPRT